MPPLLLSQEELLGFRPHPFYAKSKSQSFLVRRGDRDLGRITAIVNAGHIERYGEQRGFFGFFECEDDPAAARALFGAAADWLYAEGMATIRGAREPVAQLRVWPLNRGLRDPAVFHDDAQPAVLRRARRGEWIFEDRRPLSFLGQDLDACLARFQTRHDGGGGEGAVWRDRAAT